MSDYPRDPESGFIGRWSRLKQARQAGISTADAGCAEKRAPAARQPAPGDRAITPPQGTRPEASHLKKTAEKPAVPARPLHDADMPALDSLGEDSDFSQFLSEGVSDGLRRQALRKLFRMAQFNIRDGLDDYDDDLSVMQPLGDTLTYQMKQWLERDAGAMPPAEPAAHVPRGVSQSARPDVREEGNRRITDTQPAPKKTAAAPGTAREDDPDRKA